MKNEQIVEALLSAEWQAVVADWHGVLAGDAGERCMSKKYMLALADAMCFINKS